MRINFAKRVLNFVIKYQKRGTMWGGGRGAGKIKGEQRNAEKRFSRSAARGGQQCALVKTFLFSGFFFLAKRGGENLVVIFVLFIIRRLRNVHARGNNIFCRYYALNDDIEKSFRSATFEKKNNFRTSNDS